MIDRFKKELAPLERYDGAMRSAPAQAGLPLIQLFQRAIALAGTAADLTPRERERLPSYQCWHANLPSIGRLCDLLKVVQPDGVLANHPLSRLHNRFGAIDRPLEALHHTLPNVASLTRKLTGKLQSLDLPADCWDTLDHLSELIGYCESLSFLAEHDLLGLLVAKSDLGKRLTKHRKTFTTKEKELQAARVAASGWRQKLAPADTTTALQKMRRLENSIARFFSPGWWRLRGILKRSYDFASHQVKPTWSQILELLQREHQVSAEIEKLEAEVRDEFSFDGSFRDFSGRVTALVDGVDSLPSYLQAFHQHVATTPRGNETVQTLAALKPDVGRLLDELTGLLADINDPSLEEVGDETKRIDARSAGLRAMPEGVERHAGAACRGLAALAFARRATGSGDRRAHHSTIWFVPTPSWRGSTAWCTRHTWPSWSRSTINGTPISAKTVRDRLCRRFLDHVRIASLPHAQLTPEQKEFKTLYNRGRRELEHEFNKTMRFRLDPRSGRRRFRAGAARPEAGLAHEPA